MRNGRWLSLKEAWLPDTACESSPELASCLADAGYPLVTGPQELVAAVKELCTDAKSVDPVQIRTALRKPGSFDSVLQSGSPEERRRVQL